MCWILKSTIILHCVLSYAQVERREEFMMVVEAGSGVDPLSLWNSGSVLNDMSGKHQWNISSISQHGPFRSAHANYWNTTNFPLKAKLGVYNEHGDILWEMQFNTSQCNYTSGCWMRPDKILHSTSQVTTTLIGQNGNEFLISPTLNHSSVWLAVWNASEYHPSHSYPMFVFSANVSQANPLFEGGGSQNNGPYVFTGCYQIADLSSAYTASSATMTTDTCYNACLPGGKATFQLKTGNICYCGTIVNNNPESDAMCAQVCAGDPTALHCGTSTSYGVYTIGGGSGGSSPLKSTYSSRLGSIDFVVFPKNGTNAVMIDVLEHLGDASNPGYINGIVVNIMNMSLNYSLEYSLSTCSDNITGRALNPNDLFTTSTAFRDTGLLVVRCLWLVFNSTFMDSNTAVHVSLFYQNETKFYSGSLLAISIIKEYDVTPTTVATTNTTAAATTTNTSAAATTTTTTEASTVTLEISTEPANISVTLNTTISANVTASMNQTTTVVYDSTAVHEPTTAVDSQTEITTMSQTTADNNLLTTTEPPTELSTAEPITSNAATTNAQTTSTIEPVHSTSQNDATTNAETTSTPETFYSTANVDTTTTKPTSGEVPSLSGNTTCLCSCASGNVYNVTEAQLKVMITELRKKLLLNKTELSSYIRTKMSAKDNRTSAQGIGYSGVILLVFVIGFPVIMDMTKFFKVFSKNKKTDSEETKESKNV